MSGSAYRIVQEALTNATKQAAGAAVLVTVGVDDEALHLLMRSGPERETDASSGGDGFRDMAERAIEHGGDLNVRVDAAAC